jgi:hypothetical protein
MNINTAKHQLQLVHLHDLLKEQGVFVNYHEKEKDEEIDMLSIRMPDIEEEYILLSFIPMEGDEYNSIDLIQIHYTLPEKLELTFSPEVYLFVSRVNNYLPLGNLSIIEDSICNRHIVPHARFENIEINVLLDILNLYIQTLGIIEGIIHKLNNGTIDHKEALALFS